jgi:hypothetical protein
MVTMDGQMGPLLIVRNWTGPPETFVTAPAYHLSALAPRQLSTIRHSGTLVVVVAAGPAPQPFNAYFYVTATVIPVLFLTLAVPYTKALIDTNRTVSGSARRQRVPPFSPRESYENQVCYTNGRRGEQGRVIYSPAGRPGR